MSMAIACVGKLRERYWADAAEEYAMRLRRYGALDILECPDLPDPKKPTEAALQKQTEAEGALLLAQIKPRDHIIALCIDGRQFTSPQLASRIDALQTQGASRIVFVIGGSNGLSPAVLRRANEKLSLSAMTFPHQLARVLLLEQLYRARKILANEPYHK